MAEASPTFQPADLVQAGQLTAAAGPQALRTMLRMALNSPMPMLIWWGPEQHQFFNNAYARLWGGTQRPLTQGQPAAEYWGPSWMTMAQEVERVFETGDTVWCDNARLPAPPLCREDDLFGTYSYNPIEQDGRIAGVALICSRFYHSNAVQADGRFGYAALVHSMDVGFAIVEVLEDGPGPDCRFIEVNQAFERQTGLRNAVGKKISELLPYQDPFWAEVYQRVARTGEPVRLERELLALGRIFDMFAMRLGGPDSRQVAVLYKDITPEKKAEASRQRSEQRARAEAARAEAERRRLNAVLEATPVPVFVVDAQKQFVQANTRARQEWGRKEEFNVAGWKGWWADGSERHGQPLGEDDWPLVRALQGESPRYVLDIELPHLPGQRKTYLVTGAPIHGTSTQIEGAVVAAMDISDRVEVELALKEAHERKDEFLAMLAHELRNPLAPIGAAAELMSRPGADRQLQLQTSGIIARQVRHMTGLVDDLLDMSRVSRGLITLDKQVLELNTIAQEAVEQATPLVNARSHRLELRLAPAPVHLEGDRKRMVQIISNLLNNAAKYTPNGGNLRLAIDTDGEQVCIRVRDNGCGMDGPTLRSAFELFAQAKRSSDREQGGLGIGLALVKRLVELHGGEVSASSEGLGRGSEFTVRLPCCTPEIRQAAATLPAPKASAPQAGLQIMVVDDHVDAATTLGMLIDACGHRSSIVHTPARALQQAALACPDVFILDIGLPQMDGKELAKQLRANTHTAGATLIALTGYAQADERQAALRAGFDHYFVKPVDVNRLMSVLDELASQKASSGADASAQGLTMER